MRPFVCVLSFAVLSALTYPSASAEPAVFPAVPSPLKRFFPGEELTYALTYLGLRVGTAQARVEALGKYDGREAYRIEVRVRSHPVIDWIYKVRDEHTVWVDAADLRPLRYEKNLREGRARAYELQIFDRSQKVVRQIGSRGGVRKETSVPEGVHDQLSCGYFFRTLTVRPGQRVTLPVFADGRVWDLAVDLGKTRSLEIEGIGLFQAVEAFPDIPFPGIFFRKGKIKGWMSLDERRIPLRMETAVPVLGKIKAELESYVPGDKGA